MRKKTQLHVIDPLHLRFRKMQYKITDNEIRAKIHPRVTQQAVNKALHGNLKSLLPKIEQAINKIIVGKNK